MRWTLIRHEFFIRHRRVGSCPKLSLSLLSRGEIYHSRRFSLSFSQKSSAHNRPVSFIRWFHFSTMCTMPLPTHVQRGKKWICVKREEKKGLSFISLFVLKQNDWAKNIQHKITTINDDLFSAHTVACRIVSSLALAFPMSCFIRERISWLSPVFPFSASIELNLIVRSLVSFRECWHQDRSIVKRGTCYIAHILFSVFRLI